MYHLADMERVSQGYSILILCFDFICYVSGAALGMAMLVWLCTTLVQAEISLTIEWIAMKCTDVYLPLRVNCNNFGHPLMFYLLPSSGQNVNLSKTFTCDQMLSMQ